jgi:VCBS repeat-containing protein
VLAGDADAEYTTLVVEMDSGPAKGNLTLDADGSFRYVPASNGRTRDSFSVHQ